MICIISLHIEIVAERLGIGHTAEYTGAAAVLVDTLVLVLDVSPSAAGIAAGINRRCVTAVQFVVGETIVDHCGKGPSGNAQPLTQKEEAAGA